MGILSKADDAAVRRLACRGLLVLAALLLPMATFVTTQPGGEAQVAGTDYLWAGTTVVGGCASPSTADSLATCFSQGVPTGINTDVIAMATDGTNVYFTSGWSGGLSCPVDQLGQNCTRIMAGPWPSNIVNYAMVAADGQLWIGQGDGKIYRCPANLPYVDVDVAPPDCVLLDDAENRAVESLLLANGRLYAGLNYPEFVGSGLIWSCDPQVPNSCEPLDEYGRTVANSLAAGGGYLWAGLDNGILWRCDLNAANSCADWDTFDGGPKVSSISYDGQETVYASVDEIQGVPASVQACHVDLANSCSYAVYGAFSVVAGSGNVFTSRRSSTGDGIWFGTTPFSGVNEEFNSSTTTSLLLYIPAEGVQGVGGVDLSVRLEEWSRRIGRHCDAGGEGKKNARVTITNPNGLKKSLTTDLCDLRPGGSLKHTFDLLDPGMHKIKVRARGFFGKATVDVEANATKPVIVRLKANR